MEGGCAYGWSCSPRFVVEALSVRSWHQDTDGPLRPCDEASDGRVWGARSGCPERVTWVGQGVVVLRELRQGVWGVSSLVLVPRAVRSGNWSQAGGGSAVWY